ncbi:hypothetical protein ACGFZB_24890 [Streptomyces cinerochromogenes]|uniref:Uncharacterized protein n=1 Tax=Streptomyces cinerochromogenes TaxID=66422 RepID=A0ABW7B8W9_9ACTN
MTRLLSETDLLVTTGGQNALMTALEARYDEPAASWPGTRPTTRPPQWLPSVSAEFHRTARPAATCSGRPCWRDERLQPIPTYGHPVSYQSYLLPPGRLVGLLEQVGVVVTARLEQEPGKRVDTAPTCLPTRRLEKT